MKHQTDIQPMGKPGKLVAGKGRILGEVRWGVGPTLVVFAGIHGNETAGVRAVERFFEWLKRENISGKGTIVAIAGNLRAMEEGTRFVDADLNRLWRREILKKVASGQEGPHEWKELRSIYQSLANVFEQHKGPYYFLDLHTTSAPSRPFININDSLNNRSLAAQFGLPTILGIEEHLEGPLLSFINELGHVALGYEGGDHHNPESVRNTMAFLQRAVVLTGLARHPRAALKEHQRPVKLHTQFFELRHRQHIFPGEEFAMEPGYANFQPVKRGQLLAYSNGKPVNSGLTGRIFMPLYQSQGEDGFFLIRHLGRFWLNLSALLRKIKFERVLLLLPGVQCHPADPFSLVVNPRTARFLTTQVFHLLGYRKKVRTADRWLMLRRDRPVAPWAPLETFREGKT